MSNLVVKEFQGFNVRFEKRQDRVWGCLTDMAKASDKKFDAWYRLKTTTEYLEALADSMSTTVDQIIQATKGGSRKDQGTWAIDEVAVDFARWCSIPFRIWTNRVVLDLLTTGIATAQRSNESLEDYQKREQILKQENQRLLTENGYLQAWSPRMSFPKMRYLEMIGYTPSDHSPFLKPKEQLREYFYSPQSDWDVREGRIVQDLVDTLFEPGLKIDIDTYRFPDIDSLLHYLPSKFYSLSVNSPHTYKQVPREGYEQFARSVKVKHDNCFQIWLDWMPKKKEEFLNHWHTV